VPDCPVAARIAHPLGEVEGLDQPVHGRVGVGVGVGVQKVGNDLRIWIVLWHGSNFTADPARHPLGFMPLMQLRPVCR
jgi:hypothetical protein